MLVTLVLSGFVGLTLGLLGGGGSILLVPVLTYAGGLPPKQAITSSLLVIGLSSAAALAPQLRRGLVCLRTGFSFGAAGMVGAYGGGRLSAFVPSSALLAAFALTMLVTGYFMLERGDESAAAPPVLASGQLPRIALRGALVGLVTGLLGAGGGFLIVPALVLLGNMPMKRAASTSLLVIVLQSLAGVAGHLSHSSIPWATVAPVAALAMAGGSVGSWLSRRVPQLVLRQGFAWLVLVVGAFVLARQVPPTLRALPIYEAVFVTRWPWWLGGAGIATVVLWLLASHNQLLGVSTGCGEVCRLPTSSQARRSWRPRLLLGIVLGGSAAALLSGRTLAPALGGLDQLLLHPFLRLALLFGAGLLLGGGARLAGGCTSGHAIVGTALGARSSWLTTLLFLLGGFATTQLLVRAGVLQ